MKKFGFVIKPHSAVNERPKRMHPAGNYYGKIDALPWFKGQKIKMVTVPRLNKTRIAPGYVPGQWSAVMFFVPHQVCAENRHGYDDHQNKGNQCLLWGGKEPFMDE